MTEPKLLDRMRAEDVVQLQFRGAPRDELWFESLIVQHPANDNGIHAEVFRGDGALLFFEERSPNVYAYIRR